MFFYIDRILGIIYYYVYVIIFFLVNLRNLYNMFCVYIFIKSGKIKIRLSNLCVLRKKFFLILVYLIYLMSRFL